MTIGIQHLMLEVEEVRDRFHAAVYTARDVDAALAVSSPGCTLENLPMRTGARRAELRRYLAEDLLPHLPADLTFARVSRTGNRWRVADECTVGFTHDRELPWLLPGVPPTHRRVEVLVISIVSVQRSLVTGHRTLWDQAGLLDQLQLGPTS